MHTSHVKTYMALKKPIEVAFIDYVKAFDTVPHKRSIYKLEAYGIKRLYYNGFVLF
jgi:hypothetical protein